MKSTTSKPKSGGTKSMFSKAAPYKVNRKRVVVRSGAKDADTTRTNILNVAMEEFSKYGLSGSRIDEIAALEESYKRFRSLESGFHLENLSPMAALQQLVTLTFDYHAVPPEFVRTVMLENIHMGEHIRQLPQMRSINRSAISLLEALCQRGQAQGVFRPDLDPVDLHMSISALSFYRVSNQQSASTGS